MKLPFWVHYLRTQMYVDDILSDAHSIEEAIHNRDELIYVLKSADFLPYPVWNFAVQLCWQKCYIHSS